jgi:hypothetical protein
MISASIASAVSALRWKRGQASKIDIVSIFDA